MAFLQHEMFQEQGVDLLKGMQGHRRGDWRYLLCESREERASIVKQKTEMLSQGAGRLSREPSV